MRTDLKLALTLKKKFEIMVFQIVFKTYFVVAKSLCNIVPLYNSSSCGLGFGKMSV